MDKRYRRTERALTEAVIQIIKEKTWDAVTIEDIVSRADIARKTFYAHYENKEQLLWKSLETHFEMIEEQTNELNINTLLMDKKPLSYPIFKHVKEFKLFYGNVLNSANSAIFLFQFIDYLSQKSFEKHKPLRDIAPFMTVSPELMSNILSGALVGALRWWLNSDMQDSTEEMAYRFSQITAPGVMQSMGLDS